MQRYPLLGVNDWKILKLLNYQHYGRFDNDISLLKAYPIKYGPLDMANGICDKVIAITYVTMLSKFGR